MADFENLSDQSIVRMHDAIREQVMADAAAGTRFLGTSARQRADRLFAEINRRGLSCKPIDWSASQLAASASGMRRASEENPN